MAQAAPISDELTDEFMEAIDSWPDGEKIKQCIQCGTCSSSCPTSYAMDYTPRQIIAAVRAGLLDRVLNSNTVWMCSSCYECTVRCPSGIKLTDVMYQLKSLGVKHGLLPKGVTAPAMQRAFVAQVQSSGRNAEVGLMRRFFMSTNPFRGLKNLPLAWALFRKGRLSLKSSRVSPEGRRQLMAISEKARGV